MAWENLHWYITERCNLNCSYCFKPESYSKDYNSDNRYIANILARSSVSNIIIGGGEPTLVDDLPEVTKILKSSGKYISLHTNGILLDKGLLDKLEVDDIAIPLDSLDWNTQERLRGKVFLKQMERIPALASDIQRRGIRLGYHTVFSAINHDHIPDVYDYINKHGFDYWRIYEFNDDLAKSTLFSSTKDQKELSERLNNIETLKGIGSPKKGYTGCLLADFLQAEDNISKLCDQRIQFVRRDKITDPYAFLDSKGDVSFYAWFSQTERRKLGNIFIDGLQPIFDKLEQVADKDWEYDDKAEEDFCWATVGNMPIWARLWDGNYLLEELEEIEPKYLDKVAELSELHKRTRVDRS